MALLDLFSKRKKRERGEVPDVYQYDLPQPLRVQVVLIWRDTIGTWSIGREGHGHHLMLFWDSLRSYMQKERGVFVLPNSEQHSLDPEIEVASYFLAEKDSELALDVVELVFRFLHNSDEPTVYLQTGSGKQTPAQAIDELNKRFKEHGIGYQFDSGQIVRVDSQIVHAEVVKPVLSLLTDPAFKGPEKEYLEAHEHYRHGRHEESLVSSLKALESTIKVIGKKRTWPIDDRAPASKLIAMVFDKGLLPTYLLSEFESLKGLLNSAPTVRNRSAGHGQGDSVRVVPGYLAAYGLHSTAANILLLVEAHKATKP